MSMKKNFFIQFFIFLFCLGFVACSSDDHDDVDENLAEIKNIRPEYRIGTEETLVIEPELVGFSNGSYNWLIQGAKDEFTSNKKDLSFTTKEVGTHTLTFTATSGNVSKSVKSMIKVEDKAFVDKATGIKTEYTVDRSKVLSIQPQFVGFEDATYLWELTKGSVVFTSDKRDLAFVAVESGVYDLVYTVTKGSLTDVVTSKVAVVKESKAYSAYISKVFDFMPAVGQFTNELPKWEQGNSKENMLAKASKAIVGEKPSMISLGGFGGYVVFGFDHTIANVAGKRDFRVLGNAFWSDANPNKPGARGGSSEPGIIMVAYDKNQNGKPDEDEWYEIAGSEYYKKETIHNYQLNYYKPAIEKPGVLKEYIKWDDNQGLNGYKVKNEFHPQSYYPNWIASDKISFTGTLLQNNAVDESGKGTYWVLYAYEYGYADNVPNDDPESAIDIDWAVDKQGRKVHLPGIDFVKVYTGINQEAGWLGEVSTEVAGAYDLHEKGEVIATRK